MKHVRIHKNNIINRNKPHVIIGDLNIDILETNKTTQEYNSIHHEGNCKLMNKKIENSYTRKDIPEKHTILDHVITNIETQIEYVNVIHTDISDHSASLTKAKQKLKQRLRDKEIKNTDMSKVKTYEKLSKTLQSKIAKCEATTMIKRRGECPRINIKVL